MEAATKLGLPWRLLREKLAPPDSNQSPTEVTYRRTLEMLEDDLIVSGRLCRFRCLNIHNTKNTHVLHAKR